MMSGFVQYLKNSFLLVYWVFFKPYSLDRKLSIPIAQNNNANVRFRYTFQALAQSFLAIIIIVGTVGLFYPHFVVDGFNWTGAMLDIGVGIVGGVAYGRIGGVAYGVAGGIAFSVTGGIVGGMAGNIPGGIAFSTAVYGVAMGMTYGVAYGVKGGAAYGLAYGVIIGTFYCLAVSIVFGLMVGLSCGTATIGIVIGVITGVVFGIFAFLIAIRVHLWLFELLWVFLLYSCQIFVRTSPPLSLMPFFYNEQILLPLPLLEKWLIQHYDRSPAQTLQTLDYLTNSTNQQKLAAKARISIVVESLSRVQKFSQLTTIHQQFTWLPNPLPAEFDSSITELLEISQDSRAAETATSAYRTVELLNRPIQRLTDLQKALAFNKSRHRLSLGQTSQRWLSLLTTAQDNYRQQVSSAAEIPQAYIAGNGLNPDDAKERFKGRQDIFQQIETISLSPSPPVLLLYGGRRTGKTSSLKYLPQKVDSSLVPLLVDLQGTALSEQMSSFAQTFADQIITFARNNHRLNIPSPSPESLNHDPFPTLLKWFQEIENLQPHKRFLLCLDEFERLSEVINATNNKAPLNFFRSVMQNNQRWILLFSGSHTLDELESYWNDALINAQSLRMTYLHRNEAIDLIRHPIQQFPDIYSDATVERILYWTNCQPYLIQLLGTVLVDELNKRSEPLTQRPTPNARRY
jgi:AAA+ ATPase superfamily predicted ATPase